MRPWLHRCKVGSPATPRASRRLCVRIKINIIRTRVSMQNIYQDQPWILNPTFWKHVKHDQYRFCVDSVISGGRRRSTQRSERAARNRWLDECAQRWRENVRWYFSFLYLQHTPHQIFPSPNRTVDVTHPLQHTPAPFPRHHLFYSWRFRSR